ncbi:M35 family metallo-endopeptidase [Cupriavidus sp. PET2-C1]
MNDMRNALRNGDRTSTNGVLVGTGTMSHHGVNVAIEGDFATCPACKSGGIVTNDCYPSFDLMGQQILVEGARVNCKCPVKPIVIASQNDFTIEVTRGNGIRMPADTTSTLSSEARNKLVENMQGSKLADDSDRICPNMTNEEFARLVMERRNKAVSLVDKRLTELKRWSSADKFRVSEWFGSDDAPTRTSLTAGLGRLRGVLAMLTPDNFVRYSESAMAHVGCTSNSKKKVGVVAEVCAPDTRTHTIAIHLEFCELRDYSYTADSQVSTLIHEVSHFADTFGARDIEYFMSECLKFAKTRPELTLQNADSIAGYVIYERG